ncbi:MAG: hypothetical protein WCE64_06035 [Bacteroidales bacterium]
MYNIKNTKDLKAVINLLEDETEEKKQQLTEHLYTLYEHFSPVKVVKDVFREVVSSEDFRSNLLTATLGISTGYIAKRALFRRSGSPLKILAGNLLQYGLANLLINPPRILKSVVLPLLDLLMRKDVREESSEKTSD